MMVPGDQWPAFLYVGLDYDPEDPWKGLFKNQILVSHWWREVILRPAKSNAKSLFACQNLAPTFGRVSNWEKIPN